ncbi:MAG TPA: hypothetical protein VGC84_05955 [Ilumatobacteraceae bacterium]
MNRSKFFTVVASALIVASVIAGWVATGRLAGATQRGMARTAASMTSARELAVDTAASAVELQRVIGITGDGLGSTVDALVATRRVSAAVRRILDAGSIVPPIANLSEMLNEAEASIADVEINLAEASGSIGEAAPVLQKAITSLQTVPAELDRSIAEVESNSERVGDQVWLWRMAIAAGGAALGVMLGLVFQLHRSVFGAPGVARRTPTEVQP